MRCCDRTPLTAAFIRPGWFHAVLLGIAVYFAYLAANNLYSYGHGTPFVASAACLRVLARRGGPTAEVASGPAVSALGLLRGGCPVGAAINATVAAARAGDGGVCIAFAGAVVADGYYFVTLGLGAPPALDPVRQPRIARADANTEI